MSQDNFFNPYASAQDARIPAAVDRTDPGTGGRPGSRIVPAALVSGVEELTALFNRIKTRFVGIDADGFRVGEIVVAPSIIIASTLSNIFDGVDDLAGLIEAVRADLSLARRQVPELRAALVSLLSGPVLAMLSGIRDESEDSNGLLEAVRSDLQTLMTEASAAAILAKLDVALSTRASEVTVATLATQATLATRASEATVATLALEATQGAVKAAVEKIDNPVIAQDGVASDAMTAGVELANIAALPADGVAGRIRRVLASLKGILFTYKAYLDWGEDASRDVMRVEQQPSASAEIGADAIIVAAGTAGRAYALVYSVTVAAQVILRADAVVGGAIIKTFDLPIGCGSIDLHGLPYGNGLFFDHVSGTELSVVLYRNT